MFSICALTSAFLDDVASVSTPDRLKAKVSMLGTAVRAPDWGSFRLQCSIVGLYVQSSLKSIYEVLNGQCVALLSYVNTMCARDRIKDRETVIGPMIFSK